LVSPYAQPSPAENFGSRSSAISISSSGAITASLLSNILSFSSRATNSIEWT
jgi:hypothetical protein